MVTPRTAREVLEDEFLQVRATLLELAATLDRIEAAAETDQLAQDGRYQKILRAVEKLSSKGPGRTEQILMIFSDPYQPDWREKLGL